MSALKNLLQQIVDYAGLFPPAALPLSDVVSNYSRYVTDEYHWMLARLIVPASRLPEFADICREKFPEGPSRNRWKISALIPAADAEDDAFEKALTTIEQFNREQDFAEVDTVEGKLPRPNLIEATCDRLPDRLSAFLEIPHHDPDAIISALAVCGRPNTFGKIRTGGVTPDLIPSAERVANFMQHCASANLGFKATAGLHHPFRAEFALTYENDSPRATLHGFINVFLAACFAKLEDWRVEPLTELLETRDPAAFAFDTDSISYSGHTLSASDIAAMRGNFAISFGSCSFTEPVDDLIQAGWLANAAKTV